jgi:methylornithine synthase
MAAPAQERTLRQLEGVFSAVRCGERLADDQIRFLLGLSDQRLIRRLFQAAREARRDHFGNKVFLYGFVYFSTFCRNDCAFCRYRSANRLLPRRRKSPDEILAASVRLAESGVHLIDLTMGEDPRLVGEGADGTDVLLESLRAVKTATGLPIMISPGVASADLLGRLAGAGADWYACYQETHNRSLFARLRPGQSFDARWDAKLGARGRGLLIEEGILSGAGETFHDVAVSFAMMRALNADQLRVMTFVPQPGTPMAGVPAPDSLQELLIIAVLRLAFPDRLIPASLDVAGLDGLQHRLDAGANVITSLIAPNAGLTGVASLTRDIDNSLRMPSAVIPVLAACGLTPAGRDEYCTWIQQRRRSASSMKSG